MAKRGKKSAEETPAAAAREEWLVTNGRIVRWSEVVSTGSDPRMPGVAKSINLQVKWGANPLNLPATAHLRFFDTRDGEVPGARLDESGRLVASYPFRRFEEVRSFISGQKPNLQCGCIKDSEPKVVRVTLWSSWKNA